MDRAGGTNRLGNNVGVVACKNVFACVFACARCALPSPCISLPRNVVTLSNSRGSCKCAELRVGGENIDGIESWVAISDGE